MTQIFAPDLFTGKAFLVTGAGGGVGGATARLLATLGARLAITDVNAAALAQTAAATGAIPLLGDLAQVSACEEIIARAVAGLGRLDGLVNAAGLWVEGDSAAAREADWARCIDVNLKATFFLCSRAIPALEATRGAIVNLSSDAGVVGNAGAAIYCASKGGVTTMTRALARELAPKGIRVNALCPSDIASPMLDYQARAYGGDDPTGYFARLLAQYPQGAAARFLTPDEVAQNVAFLLSPAAAGITGAAVMLDFGLTAGY
ncbi:SDR family NAD(P)-dependent oxidoreductase [Tabrizicola oligotrophica]|uniref:SDR family oxidoreductase n=1 Tax=Tabrizicola oligotrophica TaxID=2710650 RepID=A0A6M0QNJ7_9RHOB|nr:SDR family oxidoreductase [Tabrizicola oligotrophica]NEY89048.1 SDR family oxidoreductase [Tabrizicola oligotrophica]